MAKPVNGTRKKNRAAVKQPKSRGTRLALDKALTFMRFSY